MGKKKLKELLEEAGTLTEELLKKIDIDAKVAVQEKEGSIDINIDGAELGLLIGYHGENLESLQLILSLMINKKGGSEEWVPVVLDIGGWRDQRTEELRSMIEKAVAQVGDTNESLELPPMPASQRRTTHLLLADFPDFVSHSTGEDPNRRVVIERAK